MTDLTDLFAQEDLSVDCEIKGKGGVDTGVVFSVRSLDNDASQAELKRERNKALGKRIKTKGELSDEEVGAMMGIATGDPTDEMLAHCVVSWSWPEGATLGNCKLKFNFENVLSVLKQYPWIRSQVLAKVLAVSDFT